MKLVELLKGIDVKSVSGSTQMSISGICFDSSEIKPGNLFVCIPGFKTDGHKYAPDAIKKGASAIIAERDLGDIGVTCVIVENARCTLAYLAANFYDYSNAKFKLIGVTGTNGKTTTTYLIKSILEEFGNKVGLIGTNQNMIGDVVIPSKHTTPDSLQLMQLFRTMEDEGATYVVMEVSSHALALDRVAACHFDVGAFTNITQDHLDFHKTMEDYLKAKGILFDISGTGVINIDDGGGKYLAEHVKCEKMITVGIENDCDIRASEIVLDENGVEFTAEYNGEKRHASLETPGKFSVYNGLTALGCLVATGIDFNKAVDGLRRANGVKGRVEVVDINEDYTVIIDYAHTPDGLLNVLNTIKGFAKGRVVTLFGCGGDRDLSKRAKMGKIASELSDFCIVTSDNPRSEDPDSIIKDVLVGVKMGGGEYEVVTNRFAAIEYALDHAKKDDIILLAGKGHETYQILSDTTIHFDEREIVRKLLGTEEKN
ncbi:MAG: UDP-N-acetylmuramoyl-L-alanyl-D-glutamate--2,6-diaminopimelate ligase [Oscillospiraceae bacterium]